MDQHYQLDLFRRAPDPAGARTSEESGAPDIATTLSLRDYQQEAREAIHAKLSTNVGTVAVLATGLGKTRLVGAVAHDYRAQRRKVLILCPTIELCRQMARSMGELGLTVGLEQADNFAVRPLPDVTVASVATMRGDRLKTFKPDDFGLVVFDEAHLSISKGPMAIFAHFSGAKRLGMTATPDRADRKSLAAVYESVAYDMPLLRGIEGGWLVPLKFRTVETDWDPTKLKEIAGDVEPEAVAAELARSGCLSAAVHAMCELAGDDRAIAFLPTVNSSKAFCAEVNARHKRSPYVAQWAAHVDGTTPQKIRDEVFAAFKSGVTRVISNVGILVEGWDAPHATVCAVLAPTKSRSRLAQMIGRVTRRHEGKPHALVLDFCPGRLVKGRLASPADVLEGDSVPDDVHAQLAQGGDLAEELKRAKMKAQEILDAKEAQEAAARRSVKKTTRLASRIVPGTSVYGLREHDMLEILSGGGDLVAKAAKLGVNAKAVDAERRAAGICSLKQARMFARQGLYPDMPIALAGRAMAEISKNNWQAPEWMRKSKVFTGH